MITEKLDFIPYYAISTILSIIIVFISVLFIWWLT